MHIHARSLNYFDMIRRSGSIREAARRLHVASSAVNRQLLQLEAEIGTPLFERMSTGLRLTPAGEVFSQHVITVLQDERRMIGELDLLQGIHRGSISILSVEGLSADFLPSCLERMMTQHPAIKIQVRTVGSAQAVKTVLAGEADLAIGFSIERHKDLRQCAIGRFGLGAVVRADHPLAESTSVSFAECARFPLILATPELATHTLMKPVLAHYRGTPTVLMETASIELAKSIVGRGIGVTFQTRLGLEREIADGQLVHIPLKAEISLIAELGIYVRASRTLPAALEAFIHLLTEQIEISEAEELR